MKYLGFSKAHAPSDKFKENCLDYGQVDTIFVIWNCGLGDYNIKVKVNLKDRVVPSIKLIKNCNFFSCKESIKLFYSFVTEGLEVEKLN